MTYTTWNIKAQEPSCVLNISKKLQCSEIVSRLLINRGIITDDDAASFLYPKRELLNDPFLLQDMENAVCRIIRAIDNKEKIYIYGDYDVDGITSVSVLYLYLKKFTNNIFYYIPNRFNQGYGINKPALDSLHNDDCSLIITVDTGVSAVNEIEYALSLGIDVVVTDHHECPETLPKAYAIVNPKRHDNIYPFSKLAGVGVVYKLVCALDQRMDTNYADEYIDLVAVGTIADIMPLVNENRYIVKYGLKKMFDNPTLGLKCLIDNCQNVSEITSGTVSFLLAPRINAAGRMDSAETAVELFITKNENDAIQIAKKLCDLNLDRQKIENDILEQANEIIDKYDLNDKYNALVLWDEGWHNGVIGIVASKLKDKYNKPVVLFSVSENAKGSGRSVPPFNLYDAFGKTEDILLQYGGHKYAAGVLIENEKLYEFRDRLSGLVDEYKQHKELENVIDIDCEIPLSDVSCKTIKEINKLQPYGKSNEFPVFCIRNIKITDIIPTANNKHVRLKFLGGSKTITAFYFGVTVNELDYKVGDFVDVVCELSENEYRNIKSAQLIIRDMRYTQNQMNMLKEKRDYCDNSNNIVSTVLPKREDIGIVYKFFYKNFSLNKKSFNIDTVCSLVNFYMHSFLSYEKVYFSIKILIELGAIDASVQDNDVIIRDIPKNKHFNLKDSEILLSIYNKAGVEFGE